MRVLRPAILAPRIARAAFLIVSRQSRYGTLLVMAFAAMPMVDARPKKQTLAAVPTPIAVTPSRAPTVLNTSMAFHVISKAAEIALRRAISS